MADGNSHVKVKLAVDGTGAIDVEGPYDLVKEILKDYFWEVCAAPVEGESDFVEEDDPDTPPDPRKVDGRVRGQ